MWRPWEPAKWRELPTGGWRRLLPWFEERLPMWRHLLPRRVHGVQDTAPAPAATIGEAAFMRLVIEVLELCGWLVWHDNDSRKNRRGLPDLLAVRDQRVMFIELKTYRGVPSIEQEVWGYLLCQVGGAVEYYLWRPGDWPSILEAAL